MIAKLLTRIAVFLVIATGATASWAETIKVGVTGGPHAAILEQVAQARGVERDPGNPLFRQVGENTLKGRLRSHPDVAERHYADLLQSA